MKEISNKEYASVRINLVEKCYLVVETRRDRQRGDSIIPANS